MNYIIWLAILAGALISLLLLGNLMTAIWQDVFIFRGKPVGKNYKYKLHEDGEEVTLKAKDGATIHGMRFFANEASKGVVLYFHGNAGNLDRWKNVAHHFTDRGYDIFIPDYRGFGKSEGKRNESTLMNDALLVYDYLKELYPDDEIIVYGKSIGSAFASYVGGERNPKILMLETPFFSMKDLFYTYYPWFPRLFVFKYKMESWRYLKGSKVPIIVIASGKDQVVPFKCASKLRTIMKPQDEFILVKEGKHSDLAMYDQYYTFLEKGLKP